MNKSLEWVTNLLASCSKESNGRFTIMPGRPSINPKIMIAMDHEQWGSCVVHVADGDGAIFLRNEISAITKCHELGLSDHVPKLLHSEDTGSLVAYAVPRFAQAKPLSLDVAANLIFPIHFATGTQSQIGDTPVVTSIHDWHKELHGPTDDVAEVLALVSQIDTWVLVSMIHRDFCWDNILHDRKNPVIIDWEWSEPNYPAVFDLFEYFVWKNDQAQGKLDRLSTLVESPEVAIPATLASYYFETMEREKLRIIVGLWLTDYLKTRFELAQRVGLSDPYKLEAWTWLSTWSSMTSDS